MERKQLGKGECEGEFRQRAQHWHIDPERGRFGHVQGVRWTHVAEPGEEGSLERLARARARGTQ